MADEVDIANAHIEQEEALRLLTRKPTGIQPTGFCHNCEAPLDDHSLFCDADCRDDFDRVCRSRTISGTPSE